MAQSDFDPDYPVYVSDGRAYQAPKDVADAAEARRAGRRIVELGRDDDGCSILVYVPVASDDGKAA